MKDDTPTSVLLFLLKLCLAAVCYQGYQHLSDTINFLRFHLSFMTLSRGVIIGFACIPRPSFFNRINLIAAFQLSQSILCTIPQIISRSLD